MSANFIGTILNFTAEESHAFYNHIASGQIYVTELIYSSSAVIELRHAYVEIVTFSVLLLHQKSFR